jgi:hypothetical protein
MAVSKAVSFGNGANSPDAQDYQIQQAQQLAQLLQAQSMQPIEVAPNSRISWTQGLAKMLQGYQAGNERRKVAELLTQRTQDAQDKQSGLVDALTGNKQLDSLGGSDPAVTVGQKMAAPGEQPYLNRDKLVAALAGNRPEDTTPALSNLLFQRAMPAQGFSGIVPADATVFQNGQEVAAGKPKPRAEDHALVEIVAPGSPGGHKSIERQHFVEGRDQIWEKPAATTFMNFVPTKDQIEPTAQGMAAGDLPWPTGRAATSASGLELTKRAKEINPDATAYDFPMKKAGVTAFTSGRLGNQVRAFNVGLSHLDTLQQMGDALAQHDVTLFNSIANQWAAQTGEKAPPTYAAAVQIVGQEITKAIVGAGGGEREREQAAKNLQAALSPEGRVGAFGGLRTLMVGQLGGLEQQYKSSTHKSNFSDLLTDKAREYYKPASGSAGQSFSTEADAAAAAAAGKLQPGERVTVGGVVGTWH